MTRSLSCLESRTSPVPGAVVVLTPLTDVPANVVETIRSACDRSRRLWDPNARLVVLDIKLETATAAGDRLAALLARLNDEGVATLRGGVGRRPSSVQTTLGYRRPGPRFVGEVGGSIPGLASEGVAEKHGGQTR